MKSEEKKPRIIFNHPLFFSVVLHGFLLIILSFIIIEDDNSKQVSFASITITVPHHQKARVNTKPKLLKSKVVVTKKSKVKSELQTPQEDIPVVITNEDTTIDKPEIVASDSVRVEENELYLKFARTLLDSLLISNPGYSKLILEEKVKGLKDSAFAHQELERKVNNAIHKYLLEHYPEGSEHAINQYTGPSINIPIDDLIDIIKGIF